MIQASLPNSVNVEENTYISYENNLLSTSNLAQMSIPEEPLKSSFRDQPTYNPLKLHVRSNLAITPPPALMVSTSDTYKILTSKSSASNMLIGIAKRKSSHIPVVTPPFTPTGRSALPVQPITPSTQCSSDVHSPSYEECVTVTDSEHLFDFNFTSPVCTSSQRDRKNMAATRIQKTFRSWVVRLKFREEEQKRMVYYILYKIIEYILHYL